VDGIVGQLFFEAAARRDGIKIDRRPIRRRHTRLDLGREVFEQSLLYRLVIDVPIHDEERLVAVAFPLGKRQDPDVYIDGAPCLRHRYLGDALCMWFRKDSADKRWVVSEGLYGLVLHIKVHAYCEAECRAGRPWPNDEAPGRHPRPRHCPSCRGRGK
jgi:hypothetical protein